MASKIPLQVNPLEGKVRPLEYAILKGTLETVRLLIEAGAPVNITTTYQFKTDKKQWSRAVPSPLVSFSFFLIFFFLLFFF
jgi:hypothetical protein